MNKVFIGVIAGYKSIKFNPKNLNKQQTHYKYKGKSYEIYDDQEGNYYIMINGKAVYLEV